MKNGILFILLLINTINMKAQDIIGQWDGLMNLQGIQLRLIFHITKTDTGLEATMDSPDQGAKGIPVYSVRFENAVLKIYMPNIKFEYVGKLLAENKITGNILQGGQIYPLDLKRNDDEKPKANRPQTPVKPYPYYEEEVTIENKKDKLTLSGTLTLPNKDGVYPVVVLITGSGPQNRDEEIFEHKPFLVISDYLTKKGIATLRYDDRGTYKSTGNFKRSTTVDFASDVEAAVEYLRGRKEINKKKIGLIGHSEGGIIAPMVAAKDKDIAFIVLLAGPGIQGSELLLMQNDLVSKSAGLSDEKVKQNHDMNKSIYDIILQETDTSKIRVKLYDFLQRTLKKQNPQEGQRNIDKTVDHLIQSATSPWFIFFVKYDPAPTLEMVKCPVLALNGSKDQQVPSEANLTAIKNALEKGGNKNVTIKEMQSMNHLFQECITGDVSEYGKIEQTFSESALKEIEQLIVNCCNE